MVNIRQDPFERTPIDLLGRNLNDRRWRLHATTSSPASSGGSSLVQQAVAKLAKTAIDYPPMQDPASFNLDAVKKQIDEMIKAHEGQ